MAQDLGQFKPSLATDVTRAMGGVQEARTREAARLESQVTPMPTMPTAAKPGIDLKANIGLFGAMMLLSTLGAKHTSNPMAAAMNNMNASLQGYISGSHMVQQQHTQQMWQNFESAMQQHKASLEKYKIGLDKLYKDPKTGQQQLYMSLLEEGYSPQLAAEMSSPATAARIYEARIKAHQHAEDLAEKLRQHQTVERDKQAAQFEKEEHDLEMKKAAATTPEAKKSYQDQIDMVRMRREHALGPRAPAAEKPKPTQADIDYAKAHPEFRQQFITQFGVEP